VTDCRLPLVLTDRAAVKLSPFATAEMRPPLTRPLIEPETP